MSYLCLKVLSILMSLHNLWKSWTMNLVMTEKGFLFFLLLLILLVENFNGVTIKMFLYRKNSVSVDSSPTKRICSHTEHDIQKDFNLNKFVSKDCTAGVNSGSLDLIDVNDKNEINGCKRYNLFLIQFLINKCNKSMITELFFAENFLQMKKITY